MPYVPRIKPNSTAFGFSSVKVIPDPNSMNKTACPLAVSVAVFPLNYIDNETSFMPSYCAIPKR